MGFSFQLARHCLELSLGDDIFEWPVVAWKGTSVVAWRNKEFIWNLYRFYMGPNWIYMRFIWDSIWYLCGSAKIKMHFRICVARLSARLSTSWLIDRWRWMETGLTNSHRMRDTFHVQYMITNTQPCAVLCAVPVSLCSLGFPGTDCCRRRLARAFEQPLTIRTPWCRRKPRVSEVHFHLVVWRERFRAMDIHNSYANGG